ncbi:MAG TPA: fumarylacetoacetate hydrolase family protein [Solirubrobacteraceae bacterium]|jgi:2-keto-4-pentenoate hydratase/2-oxohepta-3-ene-1,7-dioic acid hydratase in catechol pathway|nr:fumarylacetoacetate hydrolase family protein [Solirubrobacteraceae bacterium]
MIWCRFQDNGSAKYGIVDGDQVTVVNGEPWGEHAVTGRRRNLAGIKLLPPAIPSTFFCVGLNYSAHIEHAKARGNPVAKLPERPEVGYRANNALIAHGEPIVVPPDLDDSLEAEPEIVAVIGRQLRHAGRDEAQAGIFGWTIGNDISARTWQRNDRTFWRAKNCDTFKPMGPWIATDADPADATTTMRVNGNSVATFSTGDMIFDTLDYIVEITKYITMQPGDVLWMGADGTLPIGPGDTVEINISGVGTLRNSVVLDEPRQTPDRQIPDKKEEISERV